AKTAYTRKKETGRPAVWTSKYGSVTFNQYGRGFPTGGMNEAGLVVEVMTLRATVYPAADSRPVVGSLQWVQHQLDNCSTVDEVIASDARVRILSGSKAPGLHFLVSDKKGKCASIEFLAGKMVVHTGGSMPVMALANTTYAESVKRWKTDDDARNGGSDSVSRFIRAADMVNAYAGISKPPVDYAFDILSRVASRTRTQWRIVYEQTNGRIHFTTRTNKK
ncbi:MAG: linear amide C-N hydrolase, partial [Desulfobacterales bacterium]|nr:linear amide C-N hydrolase [Desulfobacterales bacterium]